MQHRLCLLPCACPAPCSPTASSPPPASIGRVGFRPCGAYRPARPATYDAWRRAPLQLRLGARYHDPVRPNCWVRRQSVVARWPAGKTAVGQGVAADRFHRRRFNQRKESLSVITPPIQVPTRATAAQNTPHPLASVRGSKPSRSRRQPSALPPSRRHRPAWVRRLYRRVGYRRVHARQASAASSRQSPQCSVACPMVTVFSICCPRCKYSPNRSAQSGQTTARRLTVSLGHLKYQQRNAPQPSSSRLCKHQHVLVQLVSFRLAVDSPVGPHRCRARGFAKLPRCKAACCSRRIANRGAPRIAIDTPRSSLGCTNGVRFTQALAREIVCRRRQVRPSRCGRQARAFSGRMGRAKHGQPGRVDHVSMLPHARLAAAQFGISSACASLAAMVRSPGHPNNAGPAAPATMPRAAAAAKGSTRAMPNKPAVRQFAHQQVENACAVGVALATVADAFPSRSA